MGKPLFEDKNHNNLTEMIQSISSKVHENVGKCVEKFTKIKWKTVCFEIPIKPEPSHRPRLCGYRVYVPGAAKNQRFFQNKVLPKLNGLFINTPCKVNADIYCETPASFTKTQKILAEMKILRPWGNTGDGDNYAKAIYDMMQPNEARGNIGIMTNDCLIIESTLRKYYSVTPRYEVTIQYMDKIPLELTKILRLRTFMDDI